MMCGPQRDAEQIMGQGKEMKEKADTMNHIRRKYCFFFFEINREKKKKATKSKFQHYQPGMALSVYRFCCYSSKRK